MPNKAEARRALKSIIAETLAVTASFKLTPQERAARKREAEIQAAFAKYFGKLALIAVNSFEQSPPSDVESAYIVTRSAEANDARDTLLKEIARIMGEAYLSGAIFTAAEVGLELSTGFNELAKKWAEKQAGVLIGGIDEHTLDVVRRAISDFITTPGATLQDIVDRLPFGEQRAQLIGITESTAAFANGNQAAANELARKYPDVKITKTWLTNNDDRVCQICAPLDGEEVAYNATFGGIENPPAHPGCRCTTSYGTQL